MGHRDRVSHIEKMRARTRSSNTVSRIFCFLYSVVMFNAWVMINAMLSAVSKPVEKTRKRMTQTQLKKAPDPLTFIAGVAPERNFLLPYNDYAIVIYKGIN